MQAQNHMAEEHGEREPESFAWKAPIAGPHALEPSAGGWGALAAVFVASAAIALALSGSELETRLFREINAWPRLTGSSAWILFNLLGEGSFLFALAALLVVRRPRILWPLVLGSCLLMLVLFPVKEAFDAPRPASLLGADTVLVIGGRLGKYSFPSGHTTTAFLAAHLTWSVLGRGRTRWLVLALAGLCGLSRIAAGAHWPADVVAGAGLGWCCGGVGLLLASRPWTGVGPRTGMALGLVLASAAVVLAFLRSGEGLLSVLRYVIGLASLCIVATHVGRALRTARDRPSAL